MSSVNIRSINPQVKYEKILKFAHRLFVEKGYHRVSIPNIVEASEISTGAIYNLFGNKEEIARTLHQEITDGFMHQFQARLENCLTTYQKLRAFAELVYDLTESDPDTVEYFLFMRHNEFIGGIAPVCMTEPFKLIREIVQEGMACGDIKKGDYFVCAVTYTGAVLRPAQLHLECVLPQPLSECRDAFIANAWAAIKA